MLQQTTARASCGAAGPRALLGGHRTQCPHIVLLPWQKSFAIRWIL